MTPVCQCDRGGGTGGPFRPGTDCAQCFLWVHGRHWTHLPPEARRKAVTRPATATAKQPTPAGRAAALACRHRGDPTGERRACESCGGTVQLPVLACAVRGECTVGKPVEGLACCRTCPDRSPPPARPDP